MLRSIPLMLLALIAYNVIALGNDAGVFVWQIEIMAIPMLSGVTWRMVLGDAMILFGLALLFVEIVKATAIGSASILDHALSTFVFIAFLVEFLLVPSAANTIFFTLTLIALIDVIAGFAVSIKGATRDVSFGR
ncbi:MAG: hypothetical protein AAGH82_08355 [Pseudomonadota bacterium]